MLTKNYGMRHSTKLKHPKVPAMYVHSSLGYWKTIQQTCALPGNVKHKCLSELQEVEFPVLIYIILDEAVFWQFFLLFCC